MSVSPVAFMFVNLMLLSLHLIWSVKISVYVISFLKCFLQLHSVTAFFCLFSSPPGPPCIFSELHLFSLNSEDCGFLVLNPGNLFVFLFTLWVHHSLSFYYPVSTNYSQMCISSHNLSFVLQSPIGSSTWMSNKSRKFKLSKPLFLVFLSSLLAPFFCIAVNSVTSQRVVQAKNVDPFWFSYFTH